LWIWHEKSGFCAFELPVSGLRPGLGVNWELLLSALGLMLVFEGLLPFINPRAWREGFMQAFKLNDGQLRFFGFLCILVGVVLLLVS
jgi:uncharacterized protein